MPRKTPPSRTLEQIYIQAQKIGAEHVMLNDAELGIVLSGDNHTLSAGTIANKRSRGDLNIPFFRAGREPRYRLADALEFRNRKMQSAA